MKSAALISVDEYLRTTYSPDCDYVDGEVIERNVGEKDHSDLQSELIHYFRGRRRQWRVYAYAEQRVQVSARRFRVPDICVYAGASPSEQVFRTPPFICIEIVSPKDRMERMQDRIDDYISFGVPYVWVIHPRTRRVWVHTPQGIEEIKDGVLHTESPVLAVSLTEVFAGLDE
jgi:Uma2 family endonuclease